MSRESNWQAVAVPVVLIAVLALAGCQGAEVPGGAAEEATETAVVRRGTLLAIVDATGSLVPQSEASLAFSSTGRVAEVLVAEGDIIRAGQPLARLETDDLELQVAQARVSAAAANRDQVMAGSDGSEIAAAQAEVATAEMEYRSALRTHDSIDKKDEDRKEQANYDLWAADIALKAAQTQLDVLLAGADADECAPPRPTWRRRWRSAMQRRPNSTCCWREPPRSRYSPQRQRWIRRASPWARPGCSWSGLH